MAQPPTWRRRIASVAVLAAAVGALIATSPMPIPSATLEAPYPARALPDDDGSHAIAVVTLELSAEALPVPGNTNARVRVVGTVTIAAADPTRPIRVRPLGVVTPAREGTGSVEWAIEELCRPAEPCRRDFEVILEPPPGAPIAAQGMAYVAKVQIVYHEVEMVPIGATARWSSTGQLPPGGGSSSPTPNSPTPSPS